jgi:hypothetical protein
VTQMELPLPHVPQVLLKTTAGNLNHDIHASGAHTKPVHSELKFNLGLWFYCHVTSVLLFTVIKFDRS